MSDVVTNSIINHELEALLDDRRLMLSNSEALITGCGIYNSEVQSKLSLRKKEIRLSLKKEWLQVNTAKTPCEFDAWLGAIIRNTIEGRERRFV